MKKKNFFMVATVAAVCAGAIATVNGFGSNNREFTALELANIEALTETENVPNLVPYGEVMVGCKEEKYMQCRVICNTLACGEYYVANNVNGIAKQVKGRCKKCGGSSFRSF